MERSELEKASHSELIDLVLTMYDLLLKTQETNQQMLKERAQEASKETKSPKKTSKNSSSRPSSDRKAGKKKPKTGKKKGAKFGHQGQGRKRSRPDVTIECKVEACPDCGTNLNAESYREVGRSQVIELPPVQPVVVEAIRYRCQCPECGQQHEGTYPEGMEAERVFGNRIETTVTYLHEVHHVSYNRLKTVLDVLFGLGIASGTLVNIIKRVTAKLKPEVDDILERVRQSNVIRSDETGARVDGQNHWQWVFVGDDATYHVVANNRSAQVIQDVMGDAIPFVWVSDLFSSQCTSNSQLRQICLSHQTRDLQFVIDAERSVWAYHFRSLLFRAQRLNKRRDTLSLSRFHSAIFQIETECNRLLLQSLDGAEESRLKRRYLKHRCHIFTFLYYSDVPPDNNESERALRNSVVHRKVSGGFRSEEGANAHAFVASIVGTAQQNSNEPFDVLSSLIGAPTPTSV